jgi:hypothetical protein
MTATTDQISAAVDAAVAPVRATVDEFIAQKAEASAQKRALVAGINQLTHAVRNAADAVCSAREDL